MKEVRGYKWPDSATESNIDCSLRRIKSLQWVLDHWSRKGCCIQAGGSYGVWPRILSKHFNIVYTFEPESQAFRCLCINCPSENLIKVQGALGQGGDTVGLKTKSWSSHRVAGDGDILYFSIDSFGLRRTLDALLLDIEGHEYDALMGAAGMIAMDRPIILVEGKLKDNHPEEVKKRVMRVRSLLDCMNYEQVADIGLDQIYTYKGEL